MPIEAFVGLADERSVKALGAAAGLVARSQKDGPAFGIESESEPPFSADRPEPHLFHIRMPRTVQRIDARASKLWPEPFQQAGDSIDFVLDVPVQVAKLRHEIVVETDQPTHESDMRREAREGKNVVATRAAGSRRNAWGIQYHVEQTPTTVDEWGAVPAYAASLENTLGPGSLAPFAEETARNMPGFNRDARILYENFVGVVRRRGQGRTAHPK